MTTTATLVIFEIGLLLLVTSIVSAICMRVKIPGLIGAIIIGLFIGGPGGIGLILELEILDIIAVLGSVILLFLIGVELDTKIFTQSWKLALIITVGGVVVALVFGFLLGLLFGWSLDHAFLLGVAISPSSTSIIASTVTNHKITQTPEGGLITVATVMDDITGVFLLSITIGMFKVKATTGGIGVFILDTVGIILLALGFIIGAIFLSKKIFPYIVTQLSRWFNPDLLDIFLFGLGLMIAYVATLFGLSIVSGAFLMGVMIPYKRFGEELLKKLGLTREIFTTIFFASIGLSINPLDLWLVLPFGALIMVITTIGRFGGGYLTAKIMRHRDHTSSIASSLIIRGEMSLIIANEAVNAGLIDSSFIPLIAVITITSILVTLPILNRVVRKISLEQMSISEITE